jgi:hypothetical protein
VYEHILSTRFFQKRKIGKKLKIEKKIWNFKPKKIENGGGGGGGGYLKKKNKKKKKKKKKKIENKHKKIITILLALKENWENRAKNTHKTFLVFLKGK